MFYLRIALTAIVFGLGACASSPDYSAAKNADDYGHHSSRLGENRYRVVFNGSRSVGPTTTRDYALLHAAELTLREGYDWFEVVDRDTSITQASRAAGGFSYERAHYVERRCGLLGCTQSTRPATTTSFGVDNGRAQERYSHVLEIVMGEGEMPDGSNYYQAAPIATALIAGM